MSEGKTELPPRAISGPVLTDGDIIDLANKALPGWTRKDNDLAYIEVVRAAIKHIGFESHVCQTRGKPAALSTAKEGE